MSTEYRESVPRLLNVSHHIYIFFYFHTMLGVQDMSGFIFLLSLDFVHKALHQRF